MDSVTLQTLPPMNADMFRSDSDEVLTVRELAFDAVGSMSSTAFPDDINMAEPRKMQTFRDAFVRSQLLLPIAYVHGSV